MADVVIIGAGVIGASVAWHLTQAGVSDVLLLEREAAVGQGSTGRATGGFRAQYGTEINVRLSLLAREKLLCFEAETGCDPGFRQCGYLFLARTPAQLAVLAAAQAVQHAAGLQEAVLLDQAGVSAVNPAVDAAGLAGAAFCPKDGFLRPLQLLRGYLDGALRGGARLRTNARVSGLRRGAAGRIESVVTADGEEIAAGCVVDAAGPWAGEVARLAGVLLPVVPLRRQVAATALTALLPEEMPMTIWVDDGFHLRVRDGRVLLLLPSPGAKDPWSVAVEPDWIERVERIAGERVPALRGLHIERERSWAGLYELSPDRHALLGRAPGCENLFLANGSSGHGVMHAPALGQLLAELIVHGAARALDVRALRPERFAEGAPIVGPDLL